MSLEVVFSNDEHIVGPEVRDALISGVEKCGSAVLLVPNYRAQVEASRQLTQTRELSLGVKVLTPAAWAQERWEVWGDGTHVVEPGIRGLVMQQVLEESQALSNDAGTLHALERLAREGLAWLGFDAAYQLDSNSLAGAGLTPAERSAVQLVGTYARRLRAAGYVELCEAVRLLPQRLEREEVSVGPVVFAGFTGLDRTTRELARGLAGQTGVRVVVRPTNERAAAGVRSTLALLNGESKGEDPAAEKGGVLPPHNLDRSAELSVLLTDLFGGEARCLEVDEHAGQRAVGIVLPAGPDAEPEALARAILKLAGELEAADPQRDGSSLRIVVSTPDVARAWRELAPKLSARGLGIRAELSLGVTQTDAGRAFFEFAESVAQLQELDASWPKSEEVPEGTVVRLGSMTWWPPRQLSDFLMSGLSGMPAARAMELDRAWRQNRLLTPGDVLTELQSKKAVPPRVEAATRELLRGRLGSAASKLLAPLVVSQDDARASEDGERAGRTSADTLALALAQGVLAKVLDVANDLRRLGISVSPEAQHPVSLATLVRLAHLALDDTSVVVRPQIEARAHHACAVELLAPTRVAQLEPCSADAVVLCGQTSVEAPVGNGDDEIEGMLASLGVEPQADPMVQAREQFVAQLAVAKRKVLLERTLVDASGKESYASGMLSELLACYGLDGSDLKMKNLGTALQRQGLLYGELAETEAFANSQPQGSAPRVAAQEVPARGGTVRPELLPYVVVPPNGRKAYAEGKPVLSASQIETYLECPLKWFSLRRLGLDSSDADFGGAQMGTFVHKVLEVTHRELLQEALGRTPDAGDLEAIQNSLTPRVPGCRVDARDADSLAVAQQKLVRVFEEERQRQYLKQKRSRSQQPLVPHTAEDEGAFRTLQRDLLSTLEYEADKFVGYEPRLFEWRFGRKGDVEEYAGVPIEGSIDRVDVDGEGRAVIIDYKHKSPNGFARDYAVFGSGGYAATDSGGMALPRHVQALMYAQVLRRRRPDLTVTGSVYLCTKGTHALSGAVSEGSVDRVFGSDAPSTKALPTMAVPTGAMDELLDATEEAIAAKVQELLAGNIEANPVDAHACDYCPVLDCERRMHQ